MASRKPYVSLGLDLTGWSGLTFSSGQTKGTTFAFDIAGLLVGARIAVWSSGFAPSWTSWLGVRGLLKTTYAQATMPRFVSVGHQNFNGAIPGWRNVYFQRPVRVDPTLFYQLWMFGAWQYQVRTAALLSGPVVNGHITALQTIVANGKHNSSSGTSSNPPIAAMANEGDMISLDVLFLPN